MSRISENELKTRGITAVEIALRKTTEAFVTVCGKGTYVVMSLDRYSYLHRCELEAALQETRKDLAEARFVAESPPEHLKRIEAMK